jgi:hypothetical protein
MLTVPAPQLCCWRVDGYSKGLSKPFGSCEISVTQPATPCRGKAGPGWSAPQGATPSFTKRSNPDLHHRQIPPQRRLRLEGAANLRPEASRWRAKNGRARSIQISRGTIIRSVHRGALSAAALLRRAPMHAVFAHWAERLRLCRDRYSLIPQNSHSALHLFVEEVSPAFRHRLEFLLIYLPGEQTTTVFVDLSSRRNRNLRHPGEFEHHMLRIDTAWQAIDQNYLKLMELTGLRRTEAPEVS